VDSSLVKVLDAPVTPTACEQCREDHTQHLDQGITYSRTAHHVKELTPRAVQNCATVSGFGLLSWSVSTGRMTSHHKGLDHPSAPPVFKGWAGVVLCVSHEVIDGFGVSF
jgi:hypothetical protein